MLDMQLCVFVWCHGKIQYVWSHVHVILSLARSLCTTPADLIDIDASTNVEITADRDDVGGVSYIGTNSNGEIGGDAGFKAIGSGSAATATIFGTQRVDIDTNGSNVEVNCVPNNKERSLCLVVADD